MSSCNVRNQNVHIVNSISHHTKPLSVSKSDCSHNVSKPVICKSLHVKPLKVSKSMSSCNVRNRNVRILHSISHHTKPLSVGKSDCSRNVNKPIIREFVVVNLSKSARKRSFNVSSHKCSVTKSLNVRSILMTSIYFYELVLLFFIFHHNFCNCNVDKVMSRVTTFPEINFKIMIVLFIMTSIFSIYHKEMFYLVQIVFILLLFIFVNIPFLYAVFLMIYFM